MTGMIEVKTASLSGQNLLWAVEHVDGPLVAQAGQLQLSLTGSVIDEAAGEQLIIKHSMWIERGHSWPWLACVSGDPLDRQPGDTRAEAAARAVVHQALGETINVPKELMP